MIIEIFFSYEWRLLLMTVAEPYVLHLFIFSQISPSKISISRTLCCVMKWRMASPESWSILSPIRIQMNLPSSTFSRPPRRLIMCALQGGCGGILTLTMDGTPYTVRRWFPHKTQGILFLVRRWEMEATSLSSITLVSRMSSCVVSASG
jgi:hypothetical protein